MNTTKRVSFNDAPSVAGEQHTFGDRIRRGAGYFCLAVGVGITGFSIADAVRETQTIESSHEEGVAGVLDNPVSILLGGSIMLAGTGILVISDEEQRH